MQAICAEAWGDDSTSAAKALGLMSLGWTMGSTLGPAFGGALSEPCNVFGSDFLLCQAGQLFQARLVQVCPLICLALAHVSWSIDPHKSCLDLDILRQQQVCSMFDAHSNKA